MNASSKLKYLGVGALALSSALFLTPAFAQIGGADNSGGVTAAQNGGTANPGDAGAGNATGVNPGTTNGTATVGQYGNATQNPYVPVTRSGGGYGLWGLLGLLGLTGFLRSGRSSYNPTYTRDELERRPLAR